jgi:hypothetical protein
MTLRQYHSDFLSLNSPIGVQEKDPQNDTYFRNKIIQKLDYFIKRNDNIGAKTAYAFCREEIDKRNKSIEEIIKEIESQVAQNNIMLKQEGKDGEGQYSMAKKAYDIFLDFLKEGNHDTNKL